MWNAKEKVLKARKGLVLDHPFFGTLALKPELKEDSTCQTGWTNGRVIAYNPPWIETLDLDETKGFFAHEVFHNGSLHHLRRGNRDPKKWNVACDYALNGILLKEGFRLPPGALYNSQYDGLSAEAIYNMLPEDAGEGEGGDPGGCGEVRDDPGASDEAQNQEQAAEWTIAVNQSKQLADKCGKLSGGMKRLIEGMVAPKVDWREVLRNFVQVASRNDYSWKAPNRRFLSQGVYLPILKSMELGDLAVFIDTSGSINEEALAAFGSEINALKDEYSGSYVVVLSCDDAVTNIQEFGADEPVTLEPVGGDGTDFRPPFEWMDTNGTIPSCAIYFTDGYCSSFPPDPGYPVLWVLWLKNEYFNPPFGEVVTM